MERTGRRIAAHNNPFALLTCNVLRVTIRGRIDPIHLLSSLSFDTTARFLRHIVWQLHSLMKEQRDQRV